MSTTAPTPVQESYHVFDTAMGPCGVAWNERGLTRVQLPDSDRGATEKRLRTGRTAAEPPTKIRQVIAQIQNYLAGHEVDFSSVPVDVKESDPLRRKIYELLRAVGWGRTITYGDLARLAGCTGPEAARDVGQAMGRNKIPLVIPCHRVLASGDRIGGFSAPGGTLTKRYLLALEGHGMPDLFRPPGAPVGRTTPR